MALIAVLPKRGRVEGRLTVPRQPALLLLVLASCGLLVAAAAAQPAVAGCTIGPGASCPSADLNGADLRGADLSGANLEGANLRRADLRGADLSGAVLEGATLAAAKLRGAKLEAARLSGVNLYGAELAGADLSEADLSGADLGRAELSEANLSGADLTGAKLFRADLRRADLSAADLSGATLSGAKLFGAELSGAVWIDGRRCAFDSVGACRFAQPAMIDDAAPKSGKRGPRSEARRRSFKLRHYPRKPAVLMPASSPRMPLRAAPGAQDASLSCIGVLHLSICARRAFRRKGDSTAVSGQNCVALASLPPPFGAKK